mgnify:CR=1 FL=1|jgi:hypothetical protein
MVGGEQGKILEMIAVERSYLLHRGTATVKKEFTLRWNDAKPGNIKKVRYGDHEAVFSVTDTGKASVRKYRCVTKPWED